jgi:acetyl esterase
VYRRIFLSLVTCSLCLGGGFAAISWAADGVEPLTSWSYPPEMPGARVEVYREVGDVKLQAWIYEPAGHTARDRRPAIVFFFGGGWSSGTPGQFLPQCRYLADRGMVAISVDYRVKSRQGVPPTECLRDAKAAIRWTRTNAERLGIDPQRIAAGGGSAGGHLAAATALVPGFDEVGKSVESSRPNALVLFNPALVLAPVDGQPDLFPQEKAEALERRGQGRSREFSPYHFINKSVPPTIIFHGTKDEAVPYATVVAFQKAMTAAGNRCELKTYEGEAHGFFNPGRGKGDARAKGSRNYSRTIQEVDEFLVSLGYLAKADVK